MGKSIKTATIVEGLSEDALNWENWWGCFKVVHRAVAEVEPFAGEYLSVEYVCRVDGINEFGTVFAFESGSWWWSCACAWTLLDLLCTSEVRSVSVVSWADDGAVYVDLVPDWADGDGLASGGFAMTVKGGKNG